MRHSVTLLITLLLTATGLADFPSEFQAANTLVKNGKQEEALAAFLKLADGNKEDALKYSTSLEQAAMCAQRLKKDDVALDLAKKIPSVQLSKLVQMRLLINSGKRQEIAPNYKEEDIASWPEEIAGESAYLRGISYMSLDKGTEAVADLKLAVDKLGEGELRGQAGLALADTYRIYFSDWQKALDTYTLVQGFDVKRAPYGWVYLTAITSAVDAQCKMGKPDDAQATLDKVDITKFSGLWKLNLQMSQADILAAKGKKAEALALLESVLADKGIAAFQKAEAQKRIASVNALPK